MLRYCFLVGFFVLAASVSAYAQTLLPADKVIKMHHDKYELGKVKFKKDTTFYMEFTNISKKPIVVESVVAGCGCTVPEKPSAPIMPGKTGKVKVGYNGSAPAGEEFSRDVTIKIKGAEPKTVYFSGETY